MDCLDLPFAIVILRLLTVGRGRSNVNRLGKFVGLGSVLNESFDNFELFASHRVLFSTSSTLLQYYRLKHSISRCRPPSSLRNILHLLQPFE